MKCKTPNEKRKTKLKSKRKVFEKQETEIENENETETDNENDNVRWRRLLRKTLEEMWQSWVEIWEAKTKDEQRYEIYVYYTIYKYIYI